VLNPRGSCQQSPRQATELGLYRFRPNWAKSGWVTIGRNTLNRACLHVSCEPHARSATVCSNLSSLPPSSSGGTSSTSRVGVGGDESGSKYLSIVTWPPWKTLLEHCGQGGVGIIIPDRGPVGWFSRQAAKKNLEPQDIWLKNGIDGCHEAL